MDDTQRLDFLIENRLRVERWMRNPTNCIYQVTDEDDTVLAEATDSRDAIDKAYLEFTAG